MELEAGSVPKSSRLAETRQKENLARSHIYFPARTALFFQKTTAAREEFPQSSQSKGALRSPSVGPSLECRWGCRESSALIGWHPRCHGDTEQTLPDCWVPLPGSCSAGLFPPEKRTQQHCQATGHPVWDHQQRQLGSTRDRSGHL